MNNKIVTLEDLESQLNEWKESYYLMMEDRDRWFNETKRLKESIEIAIDGFYDNDFYSEENYPILKTLAKSIGRE